MDNKMQLYGSFLVFLSDRPDDLAVAAGNRGYQLLVHLRALRVMLHYAASPFPLIAASSTFITQWSPVQNCSPMAS